LASSKLQKVDQIKKDFLQSTIKSKHKFGVNKMMLVMWKNFDYNRLKNIHSLNS